MNLFLFDSSLYVRRKYDNKKSKGYGIRIILNKRKESVIISSLIIIQGRNEKSNKKILCTALACSVLLVGCSKKIKKIEMPDNTSEVITSIDDGISESQTTTSQISEDDALDAFKTIISKAKRYVKNNDYTSYESLWVEDELGIVEAGYDNLNKCVTEGYTNEDYYVICVLNDNEFAVGFMASKALKQGNNTKTSKMYFSVVIKNTNAGWKLSGSKESNERFISKSLEMIPQNAKIAYQKQKMIAFDTDYIWTNRDIVVEGDVTSMFTYMWENEDGTIEIMMNIMNGTYEVKNVDYFTVKVTNDNGVVFDEKFVGPGLIEPQKSDCSIYIIPASRVYQDASKWGDMHQHTSINYK